MITGDELRSWYDLKPVKFEIVKQTGGRECGFLVFKVDNGELKDFMSRGFKIHSVSYMEYFMNAIGFFRNSTNIYYSVAHVKDIPSFTLNLKKRAASMEDFNTNFDKYVTDYDLLIDLDPEGGDVLNTEIIQQARDVCEMLDQFHIRYSIRVSGKGIHVYVAGIQFPMYDKFEKPGLYKKITENLRQLMGFTFVDDTLYEDGNICRRYCKVPWTIDVKTGNVCLPLTSEELKSFRKEDAHWKSVVKNRKIFNAGVPLSPDTGNPDVEGFLKHIGPD